MTVEELVEKTDTMVVIVKDNLEMIECFYHKYGYANSLLEVNDTLKKSIVKRVYAIKGMLYIVCDYK